MSVKVREKKGIKHTRGEFKGKVVTVFYLDFYFNGERWRESLPIKYVKGHKAYGNKKEQKDKAEEIRIQRENQILNGEYNIKLKDLEKINFYQYFKNFNDNYSQKDFRMFKATLDKFELFLKEEKINKDLLTLKAIDTDFCKRFAKYLKNCGLSGETPNNYWRRFNRIIQTLVKQKFLSENPIDYFEKADKVKKPKKSDENLKKDIFTKEELSILDKTPCGNDTVKNAFLFACFTGLGYADLKEFTWNKVKNNRLKYNRAKTGVEVDSPLSDGAKKVLNRLTKGEENDIIFNLPSDTSTNKTLRNWLKKTNIDKRISFYSGRHSWGVMLMYEGGANLKTVASLLGHVDTTHTLKYLNYASKSKKDAIQNVGSF